jgi:hypothetical protein
MFSVSLAVNVICWFDLDHSLIYDFSVSLYQVTVSTSFLYTSFNFHNFLARYGKNITPAFIANFPYIVNTILKE